MKGIGIDLCGIERIARAMEGNERFLMKYYTEEERGWISRKGKAGDQSAAAMFATKEAFLKACGIGIGGGVEMCEIEVLHDDLGAPRYQLHGKAKEKMDSMGASVALLTLTHEAGVAAAVCVLE